MINEAYPLYSPLEISSLREMVEKCADNFGNKTVFRYEDKDGSEIQISYEELKDSVMALGTAFYEEGFRNKKIAILGENSYYWLLSFLTITSGENIAVPVDRELSATAIEKQLSDCKCDVLIYSETYLDIVEALKNELCIDIEYISMESISQLTTNGKLAIENGNKAYLECSVDKDKAAVIVYTSGTTGNSKGVMLSNYNIARDTYGACQNLEFLGGTLLVLPLHHMFGLVAGVFVNMLYGAFIYINQSIRYLSSDLVKAKARTLFVVPLFVETLYKNIWRAADKKGMTEGLKLLIEESNEKLKNGIDERKTIFAEINALFGGNLETIVSGGAPLNSKYIQGFRDVGINLVNGYGITECSPVVAVNRNHYYRDGSVGLVLDECELQIRNKDKIGNGEVWIKGPIVMQGYYNKPEETAKVMDGEWFNTGDIGNVDEDGFLFITGREKNLIILANGENVAPEELEDLLSNISLVKEVIVSDKNNKIHAEIVPDMELVEIEKIGDIKGSLMEEIAKINKTLPPYKQVDEISLRDKEFEKTTTKKIKRGV